MVTWLPLLEYCSGMPIAFWFGLSVVPFRPVFEMKHQRETALWVCEGPHASRLVPRR
jgi:hypothetical protein